MSRPPSILRVAVPSPLYRLFDYLPPRGMDPAGLRPGMRIKVPFGRGHKVGVLVETTDSSELAPERLKHAKYFAREAAKHGMCPVWWDNGVENDFGLLNRRTLEWFYPDIADTIIKETK